MNSNLKETISKIEKESNFIDDFIKLMELPDEQFDKNYTSVKEAVENVYKLPDVRKKILEQFKSMPIMNIEAEKAGIKELEDMIMEDSTLSDKKKEIMQILFTGAKDIIENVSICPRELINVKVQRIDENAILPTYAHPIDAGADVYAIEDTVIHCKETKIVRTGLKVAIPAGYEIQIRPRSGISLKTGLRIANAPGTIDAGYRGEVGIIIENTGLSSYEIKTGDKIAQMVIMPVPMIKWELVSELDSTERGEGGFGSTGKS